MRPIEIPYFLELQNRLIDIFRYVSCHEDNFNTYSIKIENLFVNSCAFFDSLAQSTIRKLHSEGHIFSNTPSKFADKMKGSEMNFNDYRCLLIDEFELRDKEINLNYYEIGYIPKAIRYVIEPKNNFLYSPFKSKKGESLKWWKAFTKLKHNRIENLEVATLKHLIFSMGATYIILSYNKKEEFGSAKVPEDLFSVFYPHFMRRTSLTGLSMPSFSHNPLT